MFRHGPSCLSGPVARQRDWGGPEEAGPETATMEKPNHRDQEDRPIRTELVARVRREIAEGAYDTPDKWEIALDRLFKRIEAEE